jgi:transcriptional regulator with XRE-family HTH domain
MTTPQPGTRSHWLREQRQARGWNIQLMARKLAEAARVAGDIAPDSECLSTMIRRWEKGGGISERYQLHYCRAFQIPPCRFASTPPPWAAPAQPAANPTAGHREPVTVVLVIVLPASGQPAAPAGDHPDLSRERSSPR